MSVHWSPQVKRACLSQGHTPDWGPSVQGLIHTEVFLVQLKTALQATLSSGLPAAPTETGSRLLLPLPCLARTLARLLPTSAHLCLLPGGAPPNIIVLQIPSADRCPSGGYCQPHISTFLSAFLPEYHYIHHFVFLCRTLLVTILTWSFPRLSHLGKWHHHFIQLLKCNSSICLDFCLQSSCLLTF
jgi:hypothetical protein